MMPTVVSFPYLTMDAQAGSASLAPYLPIGLDYGPRRVQTHGLLDSGAAINVLPFDIGMQLGAIWERQTTLIQLAGNLAATEARVLIVEARVASIPPASLAFAWTRTNSSPVILGQVNFFLEFDVCFFRSRASFEVRPRSS